MRSPKLLAIGVFTVLVTVGPAIANESMTLEQILNRASKYQGHSWCGLANGKLQLGSKIFELFAYQIVSPWQQDFVLHLWVPGIKHEGTSTDSYFLRMTSNSDGLMIQDGQEPALLSKPTKAISRGQQFGFIFGLPDYLIPDTQLSSVSLEQGEDLGTIQLITTNVEVLLPGVEGKFKLVIDEERGVPIKLVAFGLDEWQGVPRGGFKVLIKFNTYPKCQRHS